MTAFALTRVVASVLALGIPFVALWFGTRWIPKRWARVYARTVIAPALWYVLAPSIYDGIARPLETGHWRCLVCGQLEDRIMYRGWVLHREPTQEIAREIDSRPFAQWYLDKFQSSHQHDWERLGCHWHANGMVACTLGWGETYYRAIPVLPDPECACSLVERVQRASPDDGYRMVRRLGYGTGDELFREIAEGAVLSREVFDERFAFWLSEHPEWE